MVESKYTHVKVNNEIELCEVYDKETKEKVKKGGSGQRRQIYHLCQQQSARYRQNCYSQKSTSCKGNR